MQISELVYFEDGGNIKCEGNFSIIQKKGMKIAKEPTATLPKVINIERQGDSFAKNSKRYKYSQSHGSPQHKDISNKKASFSEIYMKKLNEKRARKEEYHSAILAEGDYILERHR